MAPTNDHERDIKERVDQKTRHLSLLLDRAID